MMPRNRGPELEVRGLNEPKREARVFGSRGVAGEPYEVKKIPLLKREDGGNVLAGNERAWEMQMM